MAVRRPGLHGDKSMILVIARVRAKRDCGPELAALLAEMAQEVRRESGVLRYEPFCSTADPESFLMYEEYDSQAALDAHRANPALGRYRDALNLLLDGAPQVQAYLPEEDVRQIADDADEEE